MMTHAQLSDLPGWPGPHPERRREFATFPVAADEHGALWVRQGNEPDRNPHMATFPTATGVGLWVHPDAYHWITAIARSDAENPSSEWVPVTKIGVVIKDEYPAAVSGGYSSDRITETLRQMTNVGLSRRITLEDGSAHGDE